MGISRHPGRRRHHLLRPTQAPRVAVKPETLPLHATALGKVLLAYHPAPLHLAASAATDYTPAPLRTAGRWWAELDKIRTQGYATDLGEHVPEQASIAAPIKGFGGLVVAAVAVYGKTERICDSTGGRCRQS